MENFKFKVGSATVHVQKGLAEYGQSPTIRIVCGGKEETLVVENPLGAIESPKIELKKK